MMKVLLFIPGASHFHQSHFWSWPTSRVRSGCLEPRQRRCPPRFLPRRRSALPHQENPLTTRIRNRRALRDQNSKAIVDGDSESGSEMSSLKAKKARPRKPTASTEKTPAKTRTRKKAVKIPVQMVARWAVCDNGMKRVAVFDYKDRTGADAKLAAIRETKAGPFFILLVKDPFERPTEPTASSSLLGS